MEQVTKFFVYGTLRPGEVRWGSLSPYALSTEPAYIYAKMYSTGSWPFIVEDSEPGPDSSRVVGELITVAAEDVAEVTAILDRIEGFSANDHPNSLFIRRVLPVHLADGSTDVANMYVGGGSLKYRADDMRHIPSGDWKRRHEES